MPATPHRHGWRLRRHRPPGTCCNSQVGTHSSGGRSIEATGNPALIAEIHFKTISVAYRDFFPSDAPPTLRELTLLWDERLADQSACALAASHHGKPVGAVAIRRDPDFESEGQLLGLYVSPDHWGHGCGGALHDAAVQILRAQAYAKAGLWVIAANVRARHLYEKRLGPTTGSRAGLPRNPRSSLHQDLLMSASQSVPTNGTGSAESSETAIQRSVNHDYKGPARSR